MAAEPPPPPPPVNGIAERAIAGLGRGFDLTSDFKLKFCKGEERLVQLSETTPELSIPGYGVVSGVSGDIRCDKGDRVRHQSDVLEFHQMSELFNLKSSVSGKIPSGHFNSMFGFESGSWGPDARNTKCLGLDGYYIGLFSVHVDRYPLLLRDEVRNDVPSCWDPAALARFIEKYGTHIVVGVSVGGSDVVVVRQDKSSKLPPSILKKHLDDLADQLFTGSCTFTPKSSRPSTKIKVHPAFNVFDPQPISFDSFSAITEKDGISVICNRRGGDPSVSSHCEWLPTVASMPDAIHFDFIPITSLLKAVPGKGFLSHAINLYLRYKPPLSDLQYFLDFQSHKMWAPIHNDLPLGPVRKITSSSSSLQLSVMGPKLYVNTAQVPTSYQLPTTNLICFIGKKIDRLAIHLQHLSTTPTILSNALNDAVPTTTIWRSSDETPGHEAYLEPISGKKFSHVCTSPVTTTAVTSDGNCTGASYIVTGAQLHVTTRGGRPVLHLRLQFTKVTGCFIVQSTWAATATSSSSSSELVMASPISGRLLSAISGNLGKEKEAAVASVVVDSGVFPTGPPVPVQAQRMLKYVDTCQISRGPADSPGHWLVTGARLGVEKGKLGLQVKFSLLNIATSNSS
ncbi:MACPF domain-containing protein At1g14780 [Linum perenne]